jgi:hypothetical protein
MVLELSRLLPDAACPEPPRVIGRTALRHRVYNVSAETDMKVVWRASFRAFAEETPLALHLRRLCGRLSPQQWPACASTSHADADTSAAAVGFPAAQSVRAAAEAAVAAAAQRGVARRQRAAAAHRNTLLLVSMPCAFADRGSNFAGALYDSHRVLNAQHRSATPAFARGPVRRYPVAAVALTPYRGGHISFGLMNGSAW